MNEIPMSGNCCYRYEFNDSSLHSAVNGLGGQALLIR
jgi:hypothetical protein